MPNERIFNMPLASFYPHYITKLERKGKTVADAETVICWLTGYDNEGLKTQIKNQTTTREFFDKAPQINPAAANIRGVICGVRVEEITDPLMQKIRCMDILIDKAAKVKTPVEAMLAKYDN